MSAPEVGLYDAFDRVHDGGAKMIDASQCALALFVTNDGELHVQTNQTPEGVVIILRQILAAAERKAAQ